MKGLLTFLLLFMLTSSVVEAQLNDDFTDGNITENPVWNGDTNEYSVIDGQCRLNASEAGISFIHTPVNYPDSIQIDLYFEINTSPSGGNFSRIYLAIDQVELGTASGLYLQLGESGSDDAITLYELSNGVETQLASGSMGAIASRSEVNVQIILDADGFFTLSAGYDNSPILALDFETMTSFDLSTARFFGLYNTYTSSNVGNYAYDNINIKAFAPDLTPPVLIGAQVIGNREIELSFDENIDLTRLNASQISFSPSIPIDQIQSSGSEGTSFTVQFTEDLQSGPEYTCTISSVYDVLGNEATNQMASFFVTLKPVKGDIVINEILFNPEGSGKDFVEIIALTDKILNLEGLTILNTSNERMSIVLDEVILQKDGIAAFTEDTDFLTSQYISSDPLKIWENDLPDFNNSDGNVTILMDGVVLDSFDYDEDFHFNLIDDVDGVSLEKINPAGPSNTSDNWQSASSASGFATPGLPNSNLVLNNPGDEAFTIEKATFSPNLDGNDDNMVIQYALEKPGFVASIKVFDNKGFLMKDLYNNELLGTQGTLFWNGQDEDGKVGKIGIYIIYGDIFHPDGSRMTFKKSVVLADFLD